MCWWLQTLRLLEYILYGRIAYHKYARCAVQIFPPIYTPCYMPIKVICIESGYRMSSLKVTIILHLKI